MPLIHIQCTSTCTLITEIISVEFLETPLSVAVTKENACDMIIILVNGGALLDYRTRDGLTPVHKAAASGQAASVKVLHVADTACHLVYD